MSNNCNECNKCKDECGCKRPNNPGPQIAIPLTSFVWTGDPIMCGGNIIVQLGTSLDQAFANLAAYACNLSLIPGPQGVPGAVGPQGPPGADGLTAEVILQNTLHVAKNGTVAGERHNLGMPFNTIVNAAALAQPGDVIIVYPGIYNEIADWVKTDVFYYFHPGAEVVTTSHCINDNGIAKNIFICGYGKFRSSSGSCVLTTNAATNLTFQFDEVIGANDCFTLVNGNNIYVKGRKASQIVQYIATIRGGCQGIMDIEYWQSLNISGAAAIFIVNHATGVGERKKFTIKGNHLISNSSSGFGVIAHSSSGRGSIIIDEIKRIENDSALCDSIYYADSGCIKAVNKTIISLGSSAINNGSILELKDVNIIAEQKSIISFDGTAVLKNCDITCNMSVNPPFEVTGLGQMYLLSCTASAFAAGLYMMIITSNTAKIFLGNSIFTNVNADGSPKLISDGGSGAQVISLFTDNHSNMPLDAMITNDVVGTTLVVDPNILLLGSLIDA